jgi:hypothetical protein
MDVWVRYKASLNLRGVVCGFHIRRGDEAYGRGKEWKVQTPSPVEASGLYRVPISSIRTPHTSLLPLASVQAPVPHPRAVRLYSVRVV